MISLPSVFRQAFCSEGGLCLDNSFAFRHGASDSSRSHKQVRLPNPVSVTHVPALQVRQVGGIHRGCMSLILFWHAKELCSTTPWAELSLQTQEQFPMATHGLHDLRRSLLPWPITPVPPWQTRISGTFCCQKSVNTSFACFWDPAAGEGHHRSELRVSIQDPLFIAVSLHMQG